MQAYGSLMKAFSDRNKVSFALNEIGYEYKEFNNKTIYYCANNFT